MRAYVPKHQSMQLKNTTLVSSGDSEMLRVLTSIWMWTRIFEILLTFSLSIFRFHEALQNGIIISFFFCRRCNILMVWLGTGRGKWTKYISYARGLHDTIMWEYRLFIMRYRRRTFGLHFCSLIWFIFWILQMSKQYELDFRDRGRAGLGIQSSVKNFQLTLEVSWISSWKLYVGINRYKVPSNSCVFGFW